MLHLPFQLRDRVNANFKMIGFDLLKLIERE